MIYDAKIDIAVLLIFFCRPEPLSKVFEQIQIARPSKLYLYQDGPRKGRDDDLEGILMCREIVDQIDWKCEVHQWYQTDNKGCDPSEYLSQKWMFSNEEYGIVLEDDDVPSQSFFPFCKELLEKYKNDTRVNSVMGMNNMGVYKNTENSYIFTRYGSIWGWASWRRVLDTWDPKYTWLDDKEKLEIIKKNAGSQFRMLKKNAEKHREEGIEYYETIMGAASWLNCSYNIIPKYNMISDVGQTENATHGTTDLRIYPKKTQKILSLERNEINFPLVHPKEIETIPEVEYFFRHMWGSKIEYYIRYILFRDKKELLKKIFKKIKYHIKRKGRARC